MAATFAHSPVHRDQPPQIRALLSVSYDLPLDRAAKQDNTVQLAR